jgi:hypothetical protein
MVWLLREIGSQKMPENPALEKTKDQLSAEKIGPALYRRFGIWG